MQKSERTQNKYLTFGRISGTSKLFSDGVMI